MSGNYRLFATVFRVKDPEGPAVQGGSKTPKVQLFRVVRDPEGPAVQGVEDTPKVQLFRGRRPRRLSCTGDSRVIAGM